MSTLPGQASKGEKAKQKFQSLDINTLYRSSRGENLEKQQQKSPSVFIKHGMQSLGKVPNARRPPANLPSIKSEHSGTDAAVTLVPPGAPGWGKQDSSASTNSSPASQQQSSTVSTSSQNSSSTSLSTSATPSSIQTTNAPQLTAHQAAIALPVTNAIPHPHKQLSHSAQPVPTDKLWSSVMSGHQDGVGGVGAGGIHPLHYHSAQFQHEFPSLSSGDGGPTRIGPDAVHYPQAAATGGCSGLSLRPQTEGSWSQGGQRASGAAGSDMRPGTTPGSHIMGGPPQLPPQVGLQGQQQPFPPQIRAMMPSFMCKGSGFQQGPGIGIQNQSATPSPSMNGRGSRPMDNRPPRLADRELDEVTPRPIIKDEELSRMDEICRDAGWAEAGEIDYEQTLAFSDDESEKPPKKEQLKKQQHKDDRNDPYGSERQWGGVRSNASRGRSLEEEDIYAQKRNQTDKEVETAVVRAKQRREEEEKRFQEERKQGSAKKLMELEEKRQKRANDTHEGMGTINPNSVPQKPINHADIPLPDFQKDKEREKELRERDSRSRTPNESNDDKSQTNQGSSFRHLMQIEGKNFQPSKHQKPSDRDSRDQGGSSYRPVHKELPPRFRRANNNVNMQLYHQYDQRWMSNNQSSGPANPPVHNRNVKRSPEIDEERKDYKRQSSEDSFKGTHFEPQASEHRHSEETNQNHDGYSRKDYDDEKWQHREKDKAQDSNMLARSNDDWDKNQDKPTDRYERERERPQRPDSRDSRSTRHSRDSEPREYMGSWSESTYEMTYEEKRREQHRDDNRRVVPGPITKERIEAEDFKNEKRNLTQLKRGQALDVKSDMKKDENKKGENQFVNAWADTRPLASDDGSSSAKSNDDKKSNEMQKNDSKFNESSKKSEDYNQNRNRMYLSKKGWGNEYHTSRSQPWQKRSSSKGRSHKQGKNIGGTDSDASTEDHSTDKAESQKGDSQKSPKPIKKLEKDERNREAKQEKFISDQRKQEKSDKKDSYVPRGEPSRHGRGGNFRSSGRGGLSRRIDVYGPPLSKSPFGHHDDKEKKSPIDETSEQSTFSEDKTKQNQQALAAGIIGRPSQNDDRNKGKINKLDLRKSKPRGREEGCDTNSENSDEKNKDSRKPQGKPLSSRMVSSRSRTTQPPPPRMSGSNKRNYDNGSRQNSNGSLKKEDKLGDQNALSIALDGLTLKNKDSNEQSEEKEDKTSLNGDTEGFQEVKSKKTGKERQKSVEDKQKVSSTLKFDNNRDGLKTDRDRDRKPKIGSSPLTQQQIENIPSLMATPVNPPTMLQPQPKSNQFDRRQQELAPRFAKKKQQQQMHHSVCDVNDINKVGQNVYSKKEVVNTGPQSVQTSGCAWDKPLVSVPLRNIDETVLGVSIEGVKGLERVQVPPQGTSPNDKMMSKTSQLQDKPLLDGNTPLNTIIFENTNYKSTPGARTNRNDKMPRSKLEDGSIENPVMSSFNKSSMNELLQNKTEKSDSIQMPLFKEDNADMKLDFFESDLQFSDDKSAKNLCITSKPIHSMPSGNNTVDSLDIKIASVKKVWESSVQEVEDNQINFGAPSLDSNVFNQGKDTPDDSHEGYSPPNQTASTTTNVCKVKPTQQVSGSGQTVLSSTSHQTHSGIVAQSIMGNPLSPPPIPPVLGPGVGIGPQQYTANQHMGYQTSLSNNTQYGISAIPSPPTVPQMVYNSTQQLQAAAQTASLYGAFQIDQSGVLGGQGRSQYSQYPSYPGLGQTASNPYSTQSVYLQTAPPHPPPTAQAPPELYTNMSNYRLSAATAQFGQNQQLNNPSTVLISSTSNSLMSPSVKSSSQPISAIGTKAGGVGQAYQQQSQQGQQVYISYDPSLQANYLTPSASVIQRGPAGHVQNNVVPGALQTASSSYYSGSTGGQTGFFQQPGSSAIPSAQLQQHQAAAAVAGFGLQGSMFGTHNQSHTNTGLQNYNFLPGPIQMAAALNAQQYRSGLPTAATAYMKSVGGGQEMREQAGRAQQLKSPSSQEVLSSVFNSGPQIPSPKSRQNSKHPPPQSSPTAQHKYNLYQGVGAQQNQNMQRYPPPIQRPVFQQMQQNNSVNQKHNRNNPNNNNKPPNRQYYGGQNNSLSVQNEKAEDSKLNDTVSLNASNSVSGSKTSSAIGANASDKVKDNVKEETTTLKD